MKTKEKILQRSLSLFNLKGFQEVGVREIARSLEMSPGNLSYHFAKKEDILLHIIQSYSAQNSRFFEAYRASTPSIAGFLKLMQNVLRSQFNHRGVLVGNPFTLHEIRTNDRMNYARTDRNRKREMREILRGLDAVGQIKAKKDDVDFLVSFLSLFGRFAIQEAFLLHTERDEEEVVHYYVQMLSRQLSLFATKKGRRSILAFSHASG